MILKNICNVVKAFCNCLPICWSLMCRSTCRLSVWASGFNLFFIQGWRSLHWSTLPNDHLNIFFCIFFVNFILILCSWSYYCGLLNSLSAWFPLLVRTYRLTLRACYISVRTIRHFYRFIRNDLLIILICWR